MTGFENVALLRLLFCMGLLFCMVIPSQHTGIGLY